MPFHPQRRGPALRLVKKAGKSPAPDIQPEPPATRADGKPDWSTEMARAQCGDRSAYRRLLEAITPHLRALAARQMHNRGDIEDAVQDILLTVHAVRHTYDPARPFGPWLVAIANRRIVDGLRRKGRIGSHEMPFESEHETCVDPGANRQEDAVDARALREAIERLPVAQRDALHMLKLEEMSLKEASAASGASVAALKVATHRALKTLRKLINPRGNEE
ncbi:sigma-70 family RNA polymerase sigma factor [Cupriavidus sp. CV2]|uniref:sigma-70 family RNA polymerase sigma factor n=1 Tax=Cupriavidus ulmosensis TaxID=3065913 RepID=UPI00296AA096|nr:sigma-70 family RNA polymerase sigma factor [Cupriavidus sp. CV2]MDW3687295.1 sigma-70 family RNA polymerase sigma factor [Cupriavidus sp. CV2]